MFFWILGGYFALIFFTAGLKVKLIVHFQTPEALKIKDQKNSGTYGKLHFSPSKH